MAKWRMRPPNVRQTAMTCWAASISSWSRLTGGIPNWMRVDDVVAEFKTWTPNPVAADDGLNTPEGYLQFADRFGLEVVEILIKQPEVDADGNLTMRIPQATPGVKSVVTDDLKDTHFISKLRTSHVLVVLPPVDQADPAHVVVVYGVDSRRVFYMDPNARWESDALRERRNFADFGQGGSGAERFLMIWKP